MDPGSVCVCSAGAVRQLLQWLPALVNPMTATLGLTLVACSLGSAALIGALKFVVTAMAAMVVLMSGSVDHLRCVEAPRCGCA
jgi:hypothetical protein